MFWRLLAFFRDGLLTQILDLAETSQGGRSRNLWHPCKWNQATV